MFQNITLIALLISAAWIGLIGYYLYLSRQQVALEAELKELEALVAQEEESVE